MELRRKEGKSDRTSEFVEKLLNETAQLVKPQEKKMQAVQLAESLLLAAGIGGEEKYSFFH
jgi:hypothetical protein